jgi:hypothetical protein
LESLFPNAGGDFEVFAARYDLIEKAGLRDIGRRYDVTQERIRQRILRFIRLWALRLKNVKAVPVSQQAELESLLLSRRIVRALKGIGITTVGQLIHTPADTVIMAKGIGGISIRQIRTNLRARGFCEGAIFAPMEWETEQATAWKAVGSESRQFEIDRRHAWARPLVR